MRPQRSALLTWTGDTLRRMQLLGKTEPIDDQSGLLGAGIGLDSIEVLEIIAAVEESFDLTVEEDDLTPEHFSTVGSLIDFIQQRLS